ncbi:hypothetical protein [Parabacteroides sp. PF5-6]|uniref:hypothetical protein n=1 Tax=Parabacteroides sp. PF5-6 TaxID=1742403 RepID=UPI002405656A|nr:hypothetical protein [Parabacteroides sp. PF5-6]MDF9831142.1 hypothetical protein [Parabacteroides sp. PF5-6]
MELEELKASWGILSERLAQNEIVNQRLVREMIEKKTLSAQSRLQRYDLFSLVVVFVTIILLPLIKINTVLLTSSFIVLMSMMALALAVQAYLMYLLLGIDLQGKGIVENMKVILRYKLLNKRNHTWGAVVGLLGGGAVILLQGDKIYFHTMNVVTIVVLLLCTAFVSVVQYRFYRNNIAAMEKGLRELEDFEKEQ